MVKAICEDAISQLKRRYMVSDPADAQIGYMQVACADALSEYEAQWQQEHTLVLDMELTNA